MSTQSIIDPAVAPDAAGPATAVASPSPSVAVTARDLPLGLRVAGAAGAVLAVTLPMPFFKLNLPGGIARAADTFGGGLVHSQASGFGSSMPIALLLLACAVLAITLPVLRMTGREAPSWATWRALAGAGTASVAGLLFLVVSPPHLLPGPINTIASLVNVGAKPQLPLYLALASSIGIVAGALMLPGGPLAAASADGEAGRLRVAFDHARSTGNVQVLSSLGLGAGSLGLAFVSFTAQQATVLLVSIAGAIAAIVTARFSRRAAMARGDDQTVYLSRFGQVFGWSVLGFVLVLLLLAVMVLGQAAHQMGVQ